MISKRYLGQVFRVIGLLITLVLYGCVNRITYHYTIHLDRANCPSIDANDAFLANLDNFCASYGFVSTVTASNNLAQTRLERIYLFNTKKPVKFFCSVIVERGHDDLVVHVGSDGSEGAEMWVTAFRVELVRMMSEFTINHQVNQYIERSSGIN